MAAKASVMIKPMLVASPSIPSKRFRELIAPSIQQTVNGMANQPSGTCWLSSWNPSIDGPDATTIPAARTCPANFCRPRKLNRSSINPTAQIKTAATVKPAQNGQSACRL